MSEVQPQQLQQQHISQQQDIPIQKNFQEAPAQNKQNENQKLQQNAGKSYADVVSKNRKGFHPSGRHEAPNLKKEKKEILTEVDKFRLLESGKQVKTVGTSKEKEEIGMYPANTMGMHVTSETKTPGKSHRKRM